MRRVALTGATGFIGSRVVGPLRDRGFEVHVVGRHPPPHRDAVFHPTDLFDPEAVDAVLRALEATHLLHLAWYAEPGAYWRSPKNLDWVVASLKLMQSFVAHGGHRAVLAGSCAEYQWGPARFHEMTTPLVPATLYGTSKDALRRLVTAYAETVSLSVAWGRVFFLYGPGEKAGRLVSGAVAALRESKPFPTSHGHQRRDYLHVDDVAGAFAALLDADVTGPVNLASGSAIPVRSILDQVASQLGRSDLIRYGALELAASEPPIVEGDNRRLSAEVGFSPRHELADGIKHTIDWWKEQAT